MNGHLNLCPDCDFKKLYTQDRTFFNLQYGDNIEEIGKFKEAGKSIYNFDNVDLFNDFDTPKRGVIGAPF